MKIYALVGRPETVVQEDRRCHREVAVKIMPPPQTKRNKATLGRFGFSVDSHLARGGCRHSVTGGAR